VMYNPAEPRVYEYQRDAHQFSKGSADFGWTRFTRSQRPDLVVRNHGQRQAILRNDKLAFAAYIRIVNDPTGCLWNHDNRFEDSIELTGLRPFMPLTPVFAAQLPLLHFAPIRQLVYNYKDTKVGFWLQTLLWKMMSRKHTSSYGRYVDLEQSDTITWLSHIVKRLRQEADTKLVDDLFGSLDPGKGAAIGSNRLKTKKCSSIQTAIDAHPTPIETPALLTLEIQRQEFNKEKREWQKLTNKVDMPNRISVGAGSYILYAFTTHCAELESNKFNVFVRPNGPSRTWYKYSDGRVRCLTHKQAVGKHCGHDEQTTLHKSKRHGYYRNDSAILRYEDLKEVAHVAMYVRDDYQHHLLSAPQTEKWDVPQNVREGILLLDEEEESTPTAEMEDDVPKAEQTTTFDQPAPEILEVPMNGEQQPAVDGANEVVVEQLPRSEDEGSGEGSGEDESDRRSSMSSDAGYATPHCWTMDGDDVVMSDADEDCVDAPDRPDSVTTIDVLGREFYEGHVKVGAYHGQGHLIAMNGDEYVGAFSGGLKSGAGKITYASTGDTYEGDWLEGRQHGQGKLIEAATGNVFEGGWKEGKKHGKFILTGTVTDEDKKGCKVCFEAEINTAFYDCGHVVACKSCAQSMDQCPVCRRRILARLELFF
jgi:hypothetical protein